MLRLLQERAKAGVEIKIIGRVAKRAKGLNSQALSTMRLHTRTIIRDGRQAFVGSQSLRKLELDSRREVGLIVRDAGVVRRLTDTFEHDWVPVDNPLWRKQTKRRGMIRTPKERSKSFMKEFSTADRHTVKKAVKR